MGIYWELLRICDKYVTNNLCGGPQMLLKNHILPTCLGKTGKRALMTAL